MAVNFDIDAELLTKYLYLLENNNVSSVQSGNNTDENVEQTQESQNTKFYQETGYNKDNLIEDLNLTDPKVRYELIKMLKEEDIMTLLPQLEKKDLLTAMKFFTHDKLASMLSYIPEEDLSSMLLQMYSPKEIMSLLPKKTVDKFLQNDKIDKKLILKYMQKEMKNSELKEMYLCATGESLKSNDKDEILASFQTLKPEVFQESLTYMSYKHVKNMGTFILSEQPDLLQEIPSQKMAACLDKSMTSEIIDGMNALDEDILVKLTENLPPELLEQVMTMIDPEILSEYLLENATDVLDKISA